MQNPSRRAFLGGQRAQSLPWHQFLLQLQRKTQAIILELDHAEQQLLFRPTVLADLHHARQLCHAFDIKLHLWGTNELNAEDLPCLWIDYSALTQLTALNTDEQQWFVQPGVTIAQLRQEGFHIPELCGDELLAVDWLSRPEFHAYDTLQTQQSGLVHASLLMADGSVSSLGAFGQANTKPLNTPELRLLVPQLFQLANSELAAPILATLKWSSRYRWDIFDPRNKALNLAHLLLGHQGDLGVVEWFVLDKSQLQPSFAPTVAIVDALLKIQVEEIETAIKQYFDPQFLFSFGC